MLKSILHLNAWIVISIFSTVAWGLDAKKADENQHPSKTSINTDRRSTSLVWTAPKGKTVHCQDQQIPYQFDGTMDGFNPRDAFWMMWMSLRTHVSNEPNTPVELSRIGYSRYQPVNHDRTGVEGFVASNGEMAVIAYRGSTDWIDWVADFSFREVDGRNLDLGGKIHAGFAKALDGVWPQILSAIHSVGAENQTIWVTGHSLGGAMATLTAIRLAKLGYKIAPVYSFAAPRSGNEEYSAEAKEWLKGKHYRILNGQDLVPRLPPTIAGANDFAYIIPEKLRDLVVKNLLGSLKYLHDGDILWFDDDQKPWFLPSMDRGDDMLFWRRIATMARTDGVESMLRTVARRQGDLHSEKTYTCLLRTLYFEAMQNPENFRIPVSSTGKTQTL